MLRDYLSFDEWWARLHPRSPVRDAVRAFVRFLERKLSASMVVDRDAIPYGDDALADLFLLAERMRSHGILRSYHLRHDMPDE
ncbi:MAG TPA: hypothetical protein VNM40_01000, partial [Candidatus Paceibacterota bacterium]|nr:hypothetical protein [Candidatus Paceibacterota bacterium]